MRKSGDIITGNIIISAAGNNNRILRCIDLSANQSFSIPLGSNGNKLSFVHRRTPVVMDTDFGFMVKARNQLVCELRSAHEPTEITIYRDIRTT